MVRLTREQRSANCLGRSSLCGAAWHSSVAAAGPSGANRRGRVAKVGRGIVLFARRAAWSRTSQAPQPSATWVLLRLASRVRYRRCFEVALHNLPVKRDVPRRVPVVRLAQAVPPWAAPYLHR